MMPYLFKERLHQDPTQTQRMTSAILTLYGLISTISGPLIGHFADKMSNRKAPLLLSLVGCIAGTVLVVWSPSLVALFLGRALQAVAGSAVWIVGFATAADTVGQNNMGALMGVIMSFVSAGIISGPMVSGILLDVAGYWVTWSVPLGILVVDVMARLLMIENPEHSIPAPPGGATETTNLIPPSSEAHEASTTFGFWRFLLHDSRVLASLLITILSTAIVTSFHATLPLYTEEAFGWGPSQFGLMFFLLSIPAIFLSTPAGWLRDRIGVRFPVTIGLALQTVFIAFVGIAGNDRFPWASSNNRGPALYITSIIFLGSLLPFAAGVAPIELTGKCRAPINFVGLLPNSLQMSSKHTKNRPRVFLDPGAATRVSLQWLMSLHPPG